MPRQPRLDAPGYLQHLIARGIERKGIFMDTQDYEEFLNRMGKAMAQFKIQCLAWTLMPNHIHFLVRSGPAGIAPLMRSAMTGYAVYFNRKHKRSGHLFQNRYKSIICEEDSYLLELSRYIHLNPLRAGIVSTINELNTYPWSGHAVIMGYQERPWQDVKALLAEFADSWQQARKSYLQFLEAGAGMASRPPFSGGGSMQSAGLENPKPVLLHERQVHDERILGSGAFVEEVLEAAGKKEELAQRLRERQVSLQELTRRIAQKFEVPYVCLISKGRQKQVTLAKSLLIRLGVEYLNKPLNEMARWVRLGESAASQAKQRSMNLGQEETAFLLDLTQKQKHSGN